MPSTVQTRRLFEEMSKFDQESGKVNFDIELPEASSSTHFDLRPQEEAATVQNDNGSISDSLNEVKLTIESDDVFKSDISDEVFFQNDKESVQNDKESVQNDKESVQNDKNGSDIDKFVVQNEVGESLTIVNSNFSHTQNDTTSQNNIKTTPKDELLNSSHIANDVKKQLTKKITDYFSKKPH